MVDVETPDFTIGVVGAGAMGTGIAQVALTGDIKVVLADAVPGQVEKSRTQLMSRLERLVEKGELRTEALAAARTRLVLAKELKDLAPCRVVIEAVVEDLEVKRKLFQSLEAVVADDAILASN